MTSAVCFDHVSKTYRRGHAPSFREDTVRVVRRAFGRKGSRAVVNALKDVTFDIERGSAFALMGANGSGKTTALKLVSRVTYPTAGVVQVGGRVGALIEVGTGLHPELTGRENVWLYGRILGLKGNEIARRFDSIVDFAAIGIAIDQPVKQYSSGMQLRLGFALASHLEPDVLLVDEAVSVGDAGFQKRCVQRMTELNESGATLVFVSHVPSLVAVLCSTGVLLRSGSVATSGPIDDVVAAYLADVVDGEGSGSSDQGPIEVRSWDYDFVPRPGRFLGSLNVRIQLRVPDPVVEPRFDIAVAHPRAGTMILCSMLTDDFSIGTVTGDTELSCEIADLPLAPGEYEIWVSAMDNRGGAHLLERRRLGVALLGVDPGASTRGVEFAGTSAHPLVRAPYRWEIKTSGAASNPD